MKTTHSLAAPTFINRRLSNNRRTDPDPCEKLDVDLFHRKRRKSQDRRAAGKSLLEDYYDFIRSHSLTETQKLEPEDKAN